MLSMQLKLIWDTQGDPDLDLIGFPTRECECAISGQRMHPTAMAGAILWAARLRGKLKGATMDIAPIGNLRTMLWKPLVRCERSMGAYSPAMPYSLVLPPFAPWDM